MHERQKDTANTSEEQLALNLRSGKEASKVAQKLRQQRIRETIALFKRIFSQTFKSTPLPLKCHINQDIVTYWQAHEADMGALSKKHVRDTLQFYTSRLAYHEACLVKNAMRIDLTGAAIEPVSDSAKIHHQDCTDKIVTIHKKRAAQKKKQAKQKQADINTVNIGKATLGMKMSEAAITTDADGHPVLTLKKKS